jgi:hypothetical protein
VLHRKRTRLKRKRIIGIALERYVLDEKKISAPDS